MKDPLKVLESGQLIQSHINALQKQKNSLRVEYNNLLDEIMSDELEKVSQATKEVYGDEATVKKLPGVIKLRFKKTEFYIRNLGMVKRSIEEELNTSSMVIVEGGDCNSYGEYKVVYIKFGKGYIKRTRKLPSW